MSIDIISWGPDDLTFWRNVSHPILCTFSSHSEYVKRENIIFPLFLCTLLNHYQNTKKHKKIVGERASTFCVLSYQHDNFYCAGMVMFTLHIIFFGVLRKCYKITVPHSNFSPCTRRVCECQLFLRWVLCDGISCLDQRTNFTLSSPPSKILLSQFSRNRH